MKHQNYFSNKETNKEYAANWINTINSLYSDNIMQCINNTRFYSEIFSCNNPFVNANPTEIIVKETDSVSAIFEETSDKACVLNFASYKNPGGMFIEGSIAQEECLCRESILYPVLTAFKANYYDINAKNTNRALYLNRALYNPNILFIRNNNTVACDVLTCAAPNFGAARRFCRVSIEENNMVLESRCKFVLDIMQHNKVKVPILGAFGCGVFKQDAYTVANIFKKLIPYYIFDKIVFAVIPGPNAETFKKVFE